MKLISNPKIQNWSRVSKKIRLFFLYSLEIFSGSAGIP